ncbi:MAG: amidohydrolase [Candidatus Omnitrophica bacterium]|nr:amidohydrolase [Candidatus Omnitrophota bacterium]
MFIDIHVHAYRKECPPADGRTRFATPEEVIKRYDELGIEKGAYLPLIGPEEYLPQSNEDVIEICEKSGGRLFPFCNIDPRGIGNSPDADFSIWLEHYKKRGCKGIGEFMPNLPFSDPRCQNFFKNAEKAGLPIIIDLSSRLGTGYGIYDDIGLVQLENTLKKFPNLIIFGHGAAFWAEIGVLETPADRATYPSYPVREEGVVPKLMRRYPNLWGDLSAGSGYNALARDPDYAVKFLNEFQDKLCFGTDICRPDQEILIGEFLIKLRDERKLSEKAFEKIARENAIRLLGL